MTLIPAASEASGFSPTALILRPQVVLYKTRPRTKATANEAYTRMFWLNRMGPTTGKSLRTGMCADGRGRITGKEVAVSIR